MTAPLTLGDLAAGELRAAVCAGDDGLVLLVRDDRIEFSIEAAGGSREAAILGLERLASAATEYANALRAGAGS